MDHGVVGIQTTSGTPAAAAAVAAASSFSPASPVSDSVGSSSSGVSVVGPAASDVAQVRQLLLARGDLSSLAQLDSALVDLVEPSLPSDIDDEGDDDGDIDAEELFLAELEGRYPWLQRDTDTLNAAANQHKANTTPKPPQQPTFHFPSLTPALKSSIESTCPRVFLCSITCELMQHPVVAMDGHTYERVAIERWLLRRDRSPMTGETLTSKQLIPNHAIRSMIIECVEEKIREHKKNEEHAAADEKNTTNTSEP